MALEIKIGPPQVAIHQGFTVFISEPDGSAAYPSDKGLYFNDTRIISAYTVYANGEQWELLNSGAPVYYGCRIYMTNRAFPSEGGEVAARSLSFVLSRAIDGGLFETHELTNHGQAAVVFNHEVSIRSDFADIFEVKAKRIVRRGRITSDWSEADRTLTTCYRNGAFMRGMRLTADGDATAVYANGRLSFAIHLAPGQTWLASLRYDLMDGETVLAAPGSCVLWGESPQGQELQAWRDRVPTLTSSVKTVTKKQNALT